MLFSCIFRGLRREILRRLARVCHPDPMRFSHPLRSGRARAKTRAKGRAKARRKERKAKPIKRKALGKAGQLKKQLGVHNIFTCIYLYDECALML